MEDHHKPAQSSQTGLLQRAAESLRKCFMRVLAPVGKSLSPVRQTATLSPDDQPFGMGNQPFAAGLFAELLIELPLHRERMACAGKNGDTESLSNAVHQLLGAVVYCDAPRLDHALRELQLAIKTENLHTIDIYRERAIKEIDSTLRYCG